MQPAQNSTKRKVFSKEDATKTLPFVRPIMENITKKWKSVLEMDKDLLNEKLGTMKQKGEEITSLLEADNILHEIQYHIQELRQVGCYLKDLNKGMVIFPTMDEREFSYLAWTPEDKDVNKTYTPCQKYMAPKVDTLPLSD